MKDKVVIITGGSSGIGKALAHQFGRNGAKVVISGRKKQELDEALRELKAKNIDAISYQGDVTNDDHNRQLAQVALNTFGKIDILINNAGISMRALFQEVDLNVVRQVMEINFFGVASITHHCLPHLLNSKGSIIGISSIAGYRGLPGRTGYSASKFALNGFLESLRTELLKTGVHVLTACPGFTASNIRKRSLTKDGTSQGESPRAEEKMMTAEECAMHIYNATVKRKKTLVLTSQGKLTVFLNKWLPGLMDTLVYNTMAKEENSPLK